jgi:hypothetical protein
VHDGAGLLGQVEVVLHQGVLGVVPAADHALADLEAAASARAGAAEERVVDLDARLLAAVAAEEDPDRRRPKGGGDAHLLGDLSVDPVGQGHRRVGDDPQHPVGLVVERRQLGPPVGDVCPLPVAIEGVRLRFVEGVGVVERPAADSGAGQDHHVGQRMDALDSLEAQLGRPEEALEVPRRFRELLIGPPAAGFQHADLVALFGQPQRGDAATEAAADHENVMVGDLTGRCGAHVTPGRLARAFTARVMVWGSALSPRPATGPTGRAAGRRRSVVRST